MTASTNDVKYGPLKLRTAIAALLFASGTLLAGTHSQARTFRQVRAQAELLWPQTLPYQEWQTAQRSTQLGQRLARQEAPFTLQSDWSASRYQRDPDIQLREAWQLQYRQDATLQYRDSTEVALSAQTAYGRLQRPTAVDPLNRPFSVQLRLSYDLLRGGAHSPAQLAALQQEELQREQAAWAAWDWQQAQISMGRDLALVYFAYCRLAVLNAAMIKVSAAVDRARLQLQTRTTSNRDFLNIVELQQTLVRQRLSGETQIAATVARAAAHGQSWSTFLEALSGDALQCDALMADAPSPPVLSVELLHAFSNVQAAVAHQRAALLEQAATEATESHSLRPYLQGDYGRGDFSQSELASITAGLLAQWRTTGAQGRLSKQAAAARVARAAAQTDRLMREDHARLTALQVQIQNQWQLRHALEQSLNVSAELIATLEAQQAIGRGDSLNYSSATLNQMDLKRSLIDTEDQLQQIQWELAILLNQAAAAP